MSAEIPSVCARCGSPMTPNRPCRVCEGGRPVKGNKRSVSPTPRTPREIVAGWRAQMTDRRECLLNLLWRRTFAVFRVDIASEEHVPAGVLYEAMEPSVAEAGSVDGWLTRDGYTRYDARFEKVTGLPRHGKRPPPDNRRPPKP